MWFLEKIKPIDFSSGGLYWCLHLFFIACSMNLWQKEYLKNRVGLVKHLHAAVSWRGLTVRHGWEIYKLLLIFFISCLSQITLGWVILLSLSLPSFCWVSMNWVCNTYLNPSLKGFKIWWPYKWDQIDKNGYWKISVISAYF